MPWSRNDLIAFLALIVAIVGVAGTFLGIGVAIAQPEVREYVFGLLPGGPAPAPSRASGVELSARAQVREAEQYRDDARRGRERAEAEARSARQWQ